MLMDFNLYRYSADILDIVLHHHEKLDGSGYPKGLQGTTIRIVVRAMTLCDIYAALIEPRAYRPGLSFQEALQIMVGWALNWMRSSSPCSVLSAPNGTT